jgi:hypothetical protein
MHIKWMRLEGLVAVVLLLVPLMAGAQPRAREARPDSSADRARGEVQVVNDWREDVSLSVWSANRERLGEWSIGAGEHVVLQERGKRIKVRANDKITVGDGGDSVDVGQIGAFRNGVWHVNVRDVWASTHPDGPQGRDARRGEGSPRETSPPKEESTLDQILKKIK